VFSPSSEGWWKLNRRWGNSIEGVLASHPRSGWQEGRVSLTTRYYEGGIDSTNEYPTPVGSSGAGELKLCRKGISF